MSSQIRNLLRVDASARRDNSISRQLGDRLEKALSATLPVPQTTKRDLAKGLPLIDENWVAANFTPDEDRTEAHHDALALSNALVDELKAADAILITTPIYNFGVPAALKAWIDLVARARLTFRYSENGPVGLLEGKRAFVVIASGGTPVGSDIDFASGYLRHVLGFMGITDVEVIAADELMKDPNRALAAQARVDALAA